MKVQKTYCAKPGETKSCWFIVDAEGQVLGRLATRIAQVLRGKHKPTFTPHVDGGDFVVVVNAGKVKLTGNKESDKHYYRHSGYPGGIKSISVAKQRAKKAEEIIRQAVQGMLPKSILGTRQLKKLKIYSAATHVHAAQNPQPLA